MTPNSKINQRTRKILTLISIIIISTVKSQDIPHCLEYNPQKECLKCEDSYYLKSPSECAECLPHCQICDSGTTCTNCKFGFYQKNNECFACFHECKTCSDYDICTSCNSKKVLKNSKCEIDALPTFTIFLYGGFALLLLAIVFVIVGVVKRSKEKKRQERDSVIYDEDGKPRFGNIPYKYSHRKRGLTVGEQYIQTGGTQNPSAVTRPSFVPGRESYKTMERTTYGKKENGRYDDDDIDVDVMEHVV